MNKKIKIFLSIFLVLAILNLIASMEISNSSETKNIQINNKQEIIKSLKFAVYQNRLEDAWKYIDKFESNYNSNEIKDIKENVIRLRTEYIFYKNFITFKLF